MNARLLTPFATTLLFNACALARMYPMVESWRGRPSSDLIAQWGPPEAVLADGKDGTTLVYFKVETSTTPGEWKTTTIPDLRPDTGSVSYPITMEWYEPGTTIERHVMHTFRVDRDGRIYQWKRLDW